MEFKFRAVDDRPPPSPSPSSSEFSYAFQPLRMPGQVIHPMLHGLSGFLMGDIGPNSGVRRNPNDVRKLIVRELEKQRLSEEMILEEIARRRELEAVVRQEIVLLERAMAMRRMAMGALSFEDGFPTAMRIAPFAFSPRSAAFDQFPLAPLPEYIDPVVKPPSEPDKNKLIVLAKPEPNLSRVKRKALEPPTLDSDELCPFGLKKKPKEELSCALCHVSATGEKALNIHLQGKKHKRKEAALRNQKMRKNPINAPCPKKIGDPSEPKETNITASSDLEGKSLKQSGSQNGSDEIKEDAEDLKPENMLLMLKGQNARKLNKTGRSMMLRKANGSVGYKKIKKTKTANKFKFWCEMCRVGSFCSRVMEDHKKGKKHRGKLLGYEPSISEEATFKITQTSEAVPEKPEDPDVANQVNEKTTDDMSNTEAVPENPEDTDVANQANEKTINNMTKTEAVPEKPEDMDVANQANGEVTGDMANIEAVHGKPEDTDAAKQANEKITNDMTKTEAVPEKPEGTAVANQTNGKATDDMANEIQ
ncbi:uncharacterized protein LOC21387680 [Morus notabilis]|uniref:uncharacterized protein LOC21387680 n=1 Tax=Morus notabilis TaxID=981085 RepID=UPI000CECE3F0|nr:uncharacterized protein LOC21387680 [Morus notabilis]